MNGKKDRDLDAATVVEMAAAVVVLLSREQRLRRKEFFG
jgi:hypothetical protein